MKTLILILGMALTGSVFADGLNLAPLVYWESGDDGAWDLRIGGPIFQAAATADGAELMALRPLAIRLKATPADEAERLVRREVLWPFSGYRLKDDELQAWFGPLVRTNDDVGDPDSANRRWLLPFFYAGRDREDREYRAFFPIAGTLRDVAGADRISFSLFPLSVRTWKGDIHGRHWFFPIYAKVDGPDLHKHRVMPFWGYAERENRWRRSFWLWPIFQFQQSLEKPGNGGYMVFPLYGYIYAGQPSDKDYLRRRTFLWPLFSHAVTNDARLLHAPWPFFQRVTSPKEELTRTALFPFWGTQQRAAMETSYVAWPFHVKHADQRDDTLVKRTYILPFYWSFKSTDTNGDTVASYTRVWPLYSSGRAADGTKDLRMLDIWPQRNVAPIDRGYAPFWTLYRDRTIAGARHRELLWGLWQHRVHADGTRRHAFAWLFDVTTQPDGTKKRSWLGGMIGR